MIDSVAQAKHQLSRLDDYNEPIFTLAIDELEAEIAQLEKWVSDLQSGMFINCVYCGHRYGPGASTAESIPASQNKTVAQALTEHIAMCPKHPMSKLKKQLEGYKQLCRAYRSFADKALAIIEHNNIEYPQPKTQADGSLSI
jgi:hypothetical protein